MLTVIITIAFNMFSQYQIAIVFLFCVCVCVEEVFISLSCKVNFAYYQHFLIALSTTKLSAGAFRQAKRAKVAHSICMYDEFTHLLLIN